MANLKLHAFGTQSGEGAWTPPSPFIFVKGWSNIGIHRWKENLSEIKILFKYMKTFRFLDFMSNFGEMAEI